MINILDKRYRKRQKMEGILMHHLPGFSASADIAILEKELMAKLEASVARLPEKCRIVYRMSREEGKTHRQIAQELTISEKTVNNHLTKAIKDISGNLGGGLHFIIIAGVLRDII
ncbi:sigma-70 family RNA polymerase sigma factor [Pedobacter petrophilus]|uniref:Sigma-70 family RNA polymerase sigma factor n=1 Tax=Pedobacter petrophilus TaxID=1908241 RepID=A0A7K0G4X4_9SPHI|nr:sigma-70 family RNA polymerase sigma factor [Pedobacter petrophilus]